jgi:hypothetical protein
MAPDIILNEKLNHQIQQNNNLFKMISEDQLDLPIVQSADISQAARHSLKVTSTQQTPARKTPVRNVSNYSIRENNVPAGLASKNVSILKSKEGTLSPESVTFYS